MIYILSIFTIVSCGGDDDEYVPRPETPDLPETPQMESETSSDMFLPTIAWKSSLSQVNAYMSTQSGWEYTEGSEASVVWHNLSAHEVIKFYFDNPCQGLAICTMSFTYNTKEAQKQLLDLVSKTYGTTLTVDSYGDYRGVAIFNNANTSIIVDIDGVGMGVSIMWQSDIISPLTFDGDNELFFPSVAWGSSEDQVNAYMSTQSGWHLDYNTWINRFNESNFKKATFNYISTGNHTGLNSYTIQYCSTGEAPEQSLLDKVSELYNISLELTQEMTSPSLSTHVYQGVGEINGVNTKINVMIHRFSYGSQMLVGFYWNY